MRREVTREGVSSNVAIRPVRCSCRLGDYVVGPADITPGSVASYCSGLMSSESLCRSVPLSGAESILLKRRHCPATRMRVRVPV